MQRHGTNKLDADMDGIRVSSGGVSGGGRDAFNLEESVGVIEGSALVTGKGYGLFVLQDIRKGTCILDEAALITIRKRPGEPRQERYMRILTMINELSPKDLDVYSGLHYELKTLDGELRDCVKKYLVRKQYTAKTLPAALTDHLKLLAIFRTNSAGSDENAEVFAVYSRINHSCTPNIDNSHIDGRELLYAIRDIKAGEEITTSYIHELTQSRAWRANKLSSWHFECECDACTGPESAEHSKRRALIRQCFVELDQGLRDPKSIATSTSQRSHEKLQLAEMVVQLCVEEGLVGTDLSRAYRLCSECALVVSQPLKAIEYARQAVEVEMTCVGPRIRTKDSVQTWLEQLEALVEEKPRRAKHEIEKRRKAAEKIEHEMLKKSKKVVDEEAVVKQKQEVEQKEKEEKESRTREAEMAARVAESARIAAEDAKAEEKRAKEAVKTAAKKARRVIRSMGAAAGMDPEKVEQVAAHLKGDELVSFASRMSTVKDVKKIAELFEKQLQ